MHGAKKRTTKDEPIGKQLRRAREKLGLSQSQAAAKWGIKTQTLQSWEQGRRHPRGLALKHLQEILAKILKR